jgi:hypothetical protein
LRTISLVTTAETSGKDRAATVVDVRRMALVKRILNIDSRRTNCGSNVGKIKNDKRLGKSL